MAVPRRVRRFINAGVPVTLDCKYDKSNANNKGIVRSLRRVGPRHCQQTAPGSSSQIKL